MNGARCADSPGRVVSFGQVIIDLTIRVGRVPQPGEDVYADRAGVAVGAGAGSEPGAAVGAGCSFTVSCTCCSTAV